MVKVLVFNTIVSTPRTERGEGLVFSYHDRTLGLVIHILLWKTGASAGMGGGTFHQNRYGSGSCSHR